MTDNKTNQSINWHLPEIVNKAEHQKFLQSFHEQEKTLNKNRLLYPPDDVGPVSQLNYTNERRD